MSVRHTLFALATISVTAWVSPGADTFAGVQGNTPLGASQYDWFGRTYYVRLDMSF